MNASQIQAGKIYVDLMGSTYTATGNYSRFEINQVPGPPPQVVIVFEPMIALDSWDSCIVTVVSYQDNKFYDDYWYNVGSSVIINLRPNLGPPAHQYDIFWQLMTYPNNSLSGPLPP